MFRTSAHLSAIASLLLLLATGQTFAAASAKARLAPTAGSNAACPQRQVGDGTVTFDYRSRNSSVKTNQGTSPQYNYEDNWKYHTGPAIESLNRGIFSRPVLADLNFTFSHWPNHIPALLALVRYDLGGGQPHEFLPAECYFQRARDFAPDDADVLIVEGTYFYRRKDYARAKQSLEQALEINPSSADAHYNLGLLYVESGDLAKAREHADAAYSIGYPLPGLRNRLDRAAAKTRYPPANGAAASKRAP